MEALDMSSVLSQFQLSQEHSPLALTSILGADRLIVTYRISC